MARPAFLDGIVETDIDVILAAARRQKILTGQVMVRANDKAARLFLLNAGHAKYYRVTREGEEVLVVSACGERIWIGDFGSRPRNVSWNSGSTAGL